MSLSSITPDTVRATFEENRLIINAMLERLEVLSARVRNLERNQNKQPVKKSNKRK